MRLLKLITIGLAFAMVIDLIVQYFWDEGDDGGLYLRFRPAPDPVPGKAKEPTGPKDITESLTEVENLN